MAAPLALLVSMALWGSTHPLLKLALREMEPQQVIFVRVLCAGLLLLAITLLSGKRHLVAVQLRRPLPVLAQGALGFALTMNLSTLALHYVPAAVNALLINVSPIFTVLLGALVLEEALGWRAGVGVLVGFLGVALVTLSGREAGGLGPEALPGVGIGLAAALVWASYTVATRRLAAQTVDPLVMTALGACGAAVILGLLASPLAAVRSLAAASLATQFAVVWTGTLATGGTFVIWSWALTRLRAGRVATFQYLVPPIALLLAWPILGEKPSALLVLGMGLVLVGVAVTQRR